MDVINTSGRRKTAVARIYMSQGNGKVTINGRELNDYFKTNVLVYKVLQPLELTNNQDKFDIKVNVEGGGITGQAEALRLAISKALVEMNSEYRPVLKEKGLLTRDPRMVERKKPGRPKARKRFQFSKR